MQNAVALLPPVFLQIKVSSQHPYDGWGHQPANMDPTNPPHVGVLPEVVDPTNPPHVGVLTEYMDPTNLVWVWVAVPPNLDFFFFI